MPAKLREERRRALHGHQGPRWLSVRLSGSGMEASGGQDPHARQRRKGKTRQALLLRQCVRCTARRTGPHPHSSKPAYLAELQKDVTVIGQLDHAEIWNSDKWRAYNDEIDAEVVAADVEDIDF